jgi:hypothetical protein
LLTWAGTSSKLIVERAGYQLRKLIKVFKGNRKMPLATETKSADSTAIRSLIFSNSRGRGSVFSPAFLQLNRKNCKRSAKGGGKRKSRLAAENSKLKNY